jgi:hypothetical protein
MDELSREASISEAMGPPATKSGRLIHGQKNDMENG